MSKKQKNRKMIFFVDGTKKEVVGETNLFWLTKDAQFRKNNPTISTVETLDNPENDAKTESKEAL